MNVLLFTGFLLGLTSNFHCIGMCGPIAMAIPVDRTSNWTILSGALQYNAGRIFTYTILGLIVGSIGLSIHTFGILQWISIIAGIGLIIFAWRKYLHTWVPNFSFSFGVESFIGNKLGKIIHSQSLFKLPLLGSLNGLLPCGMVFAALLNAILTGDIIYSALAMTAFGIGTLPSMLAVTFMASKINANVRIKMNRIVPYMLTIVGTLVILRGMNLDIPYISPNTSIVEEVNSQTGELESNLEMSCCHSKADCD